MLGALTALLFVFITVIVVARSADRSTASTTVSLRSAEQQAQLLLAQANRPDYRPCPRGPYRPPSGEEPADYVDPCPSPETPTTSPIAPSPAVTSTPIATVTPTALPSTPAPTSTPDGEQPLDLVVPDEITVTAGQVAGDTIIATNDDGQPIQLRILHAVQPEAYSFCDLEGESEICTTPECRKPASPTGGP